ncbi:NUDIX domain-containing protein [Kitasatospora sp. NPDC048407]|uniref:NUDIX domain-containing protein n=1 Tax=Kitasatospora sp. NPDC048407 TaxID=3364051 RepID=UPI00371815E0
MSTEETVEWVEQWPPPHGMSIRQVYAVVFEAESGAVVVQDDAGRCNLPGGTPEEDDEDLVATLRRECYEESQLVLKDWEPVGYQVVREVGRDPYAQVRYAALLERADPVAPDPCTGRAYGRILVSPSDAAELLGWGDRGAAQLHAACRVAVQRWRLTIPAAGVERRDLV